MAEVFRVSPDCGLFGGGNLGGSYCRPARVETLVPGSYKPSKMRRPAPRPAASPPAPRRTLADAEKLLGRIRAALAGAVVSRPIGGDIMPRASTLQRCREVLAALPVALREKWQAAGLHLEVVPSDTVPPWDPEYRGLGLDARTIGLYDRENGRTLVAEFARNLEAISLHEIAHGLDAACQWSTRPAWVEIWRQDVAAGRVQSEPARESASEHLAESFAAFFRGESWRLSPRCRTFIASLW